MESCFSREGIKINYGQGQGQGNSLRLKAICVNFLYVPTCLKCVL